jgi:hypothetical protein
MLWYWTEMLDAGCRNTDACGIGLDADAQLWVQGIWHVGATTWRVEEGWYRYFLTHTCTNLLYREPGMLALPRERVGGGLELIIPHTYLH